MLVQEYGGTPSRWENEPYEWIDYLLEFKTALGKADEAKRGSRPQTNNRPRMRKRR